MTTAEIRLAHELKEEGYSLRDIAKEMNVPKSTVERALKTPLAGNDELDDDDETDEGVDTDEQDDDELRVLPNPVQASRAAGPARRADPATANVAAQAAMIELATQREARQAEQQRIENRKQWFVDKTNRLVRELLKNADKTTWDEEEVDDYILRVDTIKEKLAAFCEKHAIDEEGLQIWAVLTELEAFMKDHMEENRPWMGSEVTFELSKAARQSWKDMMIDSFEDEAYEEAGDDEDESEGDEDDDEE